MQSKSKSKSVGGLDYTGKQNRFIKFVNRKIRCEEQTATERSHSESSL